MVGNFYSRKIKSEWTKKLSFCLCSGGWLADIDFVAIESSHHSETAAI